MITTDECENCKYGTVIENSKSDIKVYCSVKDKYYFFGQCIPCENREATKEERESANNYINL